MSPYTDSGTLTSSKLQINDSDGWDTQTEWEAYQSQSSTEIVNGSVQLVFISQPASGISRWEFEDDSDATTAVDSWGSNALTINGASYSNVAAVGGRSLSFDGVDDVAESTAFSRSGVFSLSMWVQSATASPGDFTAFFSSEKNGQSSGSFQLDYGPSSNMRYNDQSITETFGSVTTNWEMLTITWDDAGTITGYLNGTQQFSNGSANANLFDLVFGVNRGVNQYYEGLLDDVRLYDKVLSSSEVSNLYNNGTIL